MGQKDQAEMTLKALNGLADKIRKGEQPVFALILIGDDGSAETIFRCDGGQEPFLLFGMKLMEHTFMKQYTELEFQPGGPLS